MDAQHLDEVLRRASSANSLDTRELATEVVRLHKGLRALADHLDVEGHVLDGPTVAGALRQIVEGR
jgi:hypothetical protein